jgi:hypothetical protein
MTGYRFPYHEWRQSTHREPTDWESALAAAIEDAFGKGHHDLDSLVAALNQSRIKPRDGGVWSTSNFSDLMHELGA